MADRRPGLARHQEGREAKSLAQPVSIHTSQAQPHFLWHLGSFGNVLLLPVSSILPFCLPLAAFFFSILHNTYGHTKLTRELKFAAGSDLSGLLMCILLFSLQIKKKKKLKAVQTTMSHQHRGQKGILSFGLNVFDIIMYSRASQQGSAHLGE